MFFLYAFFFLISTLVLIFNDMGGFLPVILNLEVVEWKSLSMYVACSVIVGLVIGMFILLGLQYKISQFEHVGMLFV